MRCPSCGMGSVIEIRIRVGSSELTFRRCARCEAQCWTSPQGSIPLTQVLELARSA